MSNILGITNRPTVIDGTEMLYGAKAGTDALVSVNTIMALVITSIANGTIRLNALNIPTSAVGLNTGDVYNNGSFLCVA